MKMVGMDTRMHSDSKAITFMSRDDFKYERDVGWHNVFLPKRLCEDAGIDVYEYPNNVLPCGGASLQLKRPCDEFISWSKENGVDWALETCWGDGCSIMLKNRNDAPLVKLTFDLPDTCI